MSITWRIAICLFWGFLTDLSSAQIPVSFNQSHYFGPDGPWQALAIEIGYKGESLHPINLYPAFLWADAGVFAPTNAACSGSMHGNCGLGGGIPQLPPDGPSDPAEWTFSNPKANYYYEYRGNYAFMDVKLGENVVLLTPVKVGVMDIASSTYPRGVKIPTEVGFGALGGESLRAVNGGRPRHPATAENYTSPEKGLIPNIHSDTFGLHIGMAHYDFPGSLIYGGYDKSRVIGSVASYNPEGVIQLVDIIIGVETGGSPFEFKSKSGLLAGETAGETTGADSQPTFISPNDPYIFLPQHAIEAITSCLPVHFDETSGYWLWNRNSQYERIVSSPAYLGFVFQGYLSGSSTGTVTIKVPFALLNLKLESSVSGHPTDLAYLPLMASSDTPLLNWAMAKQKFSCRLGRSFLQAAFIGANWQQNAMWLAQAPGPNGIDDPQLGIVSLDSSKEFLDPGPDAFRTSWEGHWTPLKEPLSKGEIAGIVVAVVAFTSILVWALVFIRKRKRRQRQWFGSPTPIEKHRHELDDWKEPTVRYEIPSPDRGELTGCNFRREMPAINHPSELYGTQPQPQELPAHPWSS